MAWSSPRTWVTGEVVTASMMNANVRDNVNAIRTLTIRKTADEIVNNSAVFQNDNDFFFDVAANEIWAFHLGMRVTSNTTADIKFQWTVPSGMTGRWWGLYQNGDGTLNVSAKTADLLTSPFTIPWGGVSEGFINWRGIAVVSTTAGTLQLQWAQATATVVDTKIFADSFLIAQRVAV
jgi:hypothetical protein